jgi:hypothetical protein
LKFFIYLAEKKSAKKKKIIKADPPKLQPHNAFWNSPIHQTPTPSLNKAPVTKEIVSIYKFDFRK